MTDASSAHGSIHLASSFFGARSDQPFPKLTAMSAKSHRLQMRDLEVATRQPEDADALEKEIGHLRELFAASQEHNAMLQEDRDKAFARVAEYDAERRQALEDPRYRQRIGIQADAQRLEELNRARSEIWSETFAAQRALAEFQSERSACTALRDEVAQQRAIIFQQEEALGNRDR